MLAVHASTWISLLMVGAPPSDLSEIQALTSAAQQLVPEEDSEKNLAKKLAASSIRLLLDSEKSGGQEIRRIIESDEFRDDIEGIFLRRIQNLSRNKLSRNQVLAELIRQSTSLLYAQRSLDQWLGLPPRSLTENPATQQTVSQPNRSSSALEQGMRSLTMIGRSETTAESADKNDTAHLPANESGLLTGQLRWQPKSGSPKSELSLDQLRLVEDLGGSGSQNGTIEMGEWVFLSVSVRNEGQLPWFSASVSPRAVGECVFVEASTMNLGEIQPGESSSPVTFWAYLSSGCPNRNLYQLLVRVEDSHRGSSGENLGISISPEDAPYVAAVNVRLDNDQLGFSSGEGVARLEPGIKAEYSMDIRHPPGVHSATQEYAFPAAFDGIFSNRLYQSGLQMIEAGGNIWRARDDVDLWVSPVSEYNSSLKKNPLLRRINEASSSYVMVIAADIVFHQNLERNSAAAPSTPVEDGASKQCRNDQAKLDPDAVENPSAADFLKLIEQHLIVRPHEITGQGPSTLRAVAGYEVSIDRESFLREYERLIGAAGEAPPADPSCIDAPQGSSEMPVRRLSQRIYQAIPLAPVTLAAAPAEDLTPAPTLVVTEMPIQLDFGALVDVSTYTRGVGEAGENDPLRPIALGGAGVRFIYGRDLTGIVAGQFAYGSYESVAGISQVALSDIAGELGAGYRLSLDRISIMPTATAGVRRRSFHVDDADRAKIGFFASVGAQVRFGFTEMIGVYVEGAARIGQTGPSASVDTAELGGFSGRGSGGLSLQF